MLPHNPEADIPGFVIGFGVSLLGAIMLFIGFTGAFASKLIVIVFRAKLINSVVRCWDDCIIAWYRIHCVSSLLPNQTVHELIV
jgi:hypothetical protein